jgi:hypothetical protein
MSIIYGTREAATIGVPSQITITYPTPRETLLETPIALPTSEPGSPQITFTVIEDDLPVLSGAALSDVTLIPAFFAGGTNEAETANIHYARVFKNGVEVGAPNTACDGEPLWTYSFYLFADIAVGDVVTISLWADSAGLTYDYAAMAIMISRPDVASGGDILLNVAYNDVSNYPALTLGDPGVFSATNAFSVASGPSLSASVDTDRAFGVLEFDASYAYLFIVAFGDPSNQVRAFLAVSADTRPFYLTNKVPTSVDWLGTSMRVTS